MNGVQMYALRYYLEQLHRQGLSYVEAKRRANQFIDWAGGDYDKALAAMKEDLVKARVRV